MSNSEAIEEALQKYRQEHEIKKLPARLKCKWLKEARNTDTNG